MNTTLLRLVEVRLIVKIRYDKAPFNPPDAHGDGEYLGDGEGGGTGSGNHLGFGDAFDRGSGKGAGRQSGTINGNGKGYPI